MRNKLYWGLGALAVCIIGATVFLVLKDQAEIREWKRQLAKDLQGHYHSDGTFHHGPHDEHESAADVPRDDVSQAKPGNVQKIKPVEVPKEETRKEEPKKPLYTGPLTFHEELLKTNPVKALRLQTEERGHWSAKWIPPFPPDDEEAAAIARDLYLITYYESIGDTNNSICQKALRRYEAMLIAHSKKIEEWSDRRTAIPFEDAFANTEEYQQVKWEGARMNDLARVMWARVTEGLILNPARFARKTLLPNLE